jgi:hypothetical protein
VNYSLGTGANHKAFDVCHKCFEIASYQIGHTTLDEIRSNIAKGYIAPAKMPNEKKIGDSGGRIKNPPGIIKALSV